MQHPFVHIRVHSHYSLGESTIQVKDLVKKTAASAMPAVGLTDYHNLFASLEFSKAAADTGVQPLVGCVLPVFDPAAAQPTADSLTLIAASDAGYQNLLKLASGIYLQPASAAVMGIHPQLVRDHAEGLIALTDGPKGKVGRLLLSGQTDAAREALLELAGVFDGRLYVELMRHGLVTQQKIEEAVVNLALDHNLPLLATNDVHFLAPDQYEAHEILLCISDGTFIYDDNRRRLTPEHYFKSPEAMCELFSDVPEAIENTLFLAERCAAMSPARKPILPAFSSEAGRDEDEEFRHQAREGLERRLLEFVLRPGLSADEQATLRKEYEDRLTFELDVIVRMKYSGYFLIVSDFIKWSKRNGIPVGPGRGSGAGSIAAWSLEITDLDPIRFGLLFERFLNPDRVSMPDFDVDFCQDRRDEVIRYVTDKYGNDRVAQIITFGKLQARAVLRDVGRVLQMPFGQVDRICKLVPVNPADPIDLSRALELEPLLRQMRRDDEQVEKLFSIALKLEGLNRHSSTHAAGIVIGDRPLEELVPVYLEEPGGMPVIQYSMKYAEDAGLVKFDFLGLKTLTVVERAVAFIHRHTPDFDIRTIPFDDRVTYDLLGRGDAIGVFQLESSGMRDTLRKMKPDTIEDLIALISLYRPGPMDNIPTYIARKHGLETPEYPHPLLETILKETFGVIIYQEQVMQIAQVLAGYTLAEADLLRRAMGKKIRAEMEAQREIFANKAVEKGVDRKNAAEVFDLIAKFASYGFNKSHAAAYALISYQTAYLKANYPLEFFAASMTYEMHDTDKLSLFRGDAVRLGYRILPPDLNRSEVAFSVETLEDGSRAVRYALAAVKNVGASAMQSVVEERRRNGPFRDVFDFARRLEPQAMNRRTLESLTKAGAMECLMPNRRMTFESAELILSYCAACHEERSSAQVSLFGGPAEQAEVLLPKLPEMPDWDRQLKLQGEMEAVGYYLSGHPLEDFMPYLPHVTWSHDFGSVLDGSGYRQFTCAGVVVDKKIKVSQRGRFAFIGLSDPYSTYEASIFDEQLLNNVRHALENGTMLVLHVDGKMEEGGPRLIVTRLQTVEDTLSQQLRDVKFQVRKPEHLQTIRRALTPKPGAARVAIRISVDESRSVEMTLPERYMIRVEDMSLLRELVAA